MYLVKILMVVGETIKVGVWMEFELSYIQRWFDIILKSLQD